MVEVSEPLVLGHSQHLLFLVVLVSEEPNSLNVLLPHYVKHAALFGILKLRLLLRLVYVPFLFLLSRVASRAHHADSLLEVELSLGLLN